MLLRWSSRKTGARAVRVQARSGSFSDAISGQANHGLRGGILVATTSDPIHELWYLVRRRRPRPVGFREENRYFGSYFLLDPGRNSVTFDEVSTERLIV